MQIQDADCWVYNIDDHGGNTINGFFIIKSLIELQ